MEEQVQTSGGLTTHTQSRSIGGVVLVVANVVLEKTRSTVVGETLHKLDNGDEEGRGRQVLANTAQRPLLKVIGLLAIGSVALLGTLR